MIKQEHIRQIVNRAFTIACHSGGDPFAAEFFDAAMGEVREILVSAHAPVQSERVARVEIKNRDNWKEELRLLRTYLPHNYQACCVDNSATGEGYIRITGLDDSGWTLDGYVIPRLQSGLIVAKEIT